MERLKCSVRDARSTDYGMLVLLAEETLHPLASGAGHPERYRSDELLDLLERADVYIAETDNEVAGFAAVETREEVLAVRCVCVSPAFEARGVANQLLDWIEGVAVGRHLARLTAIVPADDHLSRHLYAGHAFVAAPSEGAAEMVLLEKRLPLLED